MKTAVRKLLNYWLPPQSGKPDVCQECGEALRVAESVGFKTFTDEQRANLRATLLSFLIGVQ
jgi:hypothetical protein